MRQGSLLLCHTPVPHTNHFYAIMFPLLKFRSKTLKPEGVPCTRPWVPTLHKKKKKEKKNKKNYSQVSATETSIPNLAEGTVIHSWSQPICPCNTLSGSALLPQRCFATSCENQSGRCNSLRTAPWGTNSKTRV